MNVMQIDKIKNVLENDDSILAAYLFGSQAKGKPNKYSDVDIAVLFNERSGKESYMDKIMALMTDLSNILRKEVDVVTLNQASLFLRYHVLKEGKKIYEKKDRNEHNFEAQAILQYFDFLPVKTLIENGMLAKIKAA